MRANHRESRAQAAPRQEVLDLSICDLPLSSVTLSGRYSSMPQVTHHYDTALEEG